MEKRSRRRIRDLVALAAFQGLSENEIWCARISMMAWSTNAPFKGRIQKRKTNHLQIIKSSLQRTAGPYRCAKGGHSISTSAQARAGSFGRTTVSPSGSMFQTRSRMWIGRHVDVRQNAATHCG
jgi:hypothetical protein